MIFLESFFSACMINDALFNFIQITVVNPALDEALEILQKFAVDVYNGKVSEDRLRFGAPWRHPPQIDDPKLRMEWAKLQLMDFVQSLANTEFGVNLLIFLQIIFCSCVTTVQLKNERYWSKIL